MILSEIRDYLAERGRAPLSDLAIRFDTDAEAVRAMLDHWIRKGRVRRIRDEDSLCGGCCNCGAEGPEVYEWVQRPAPPG
jgi:hypothetical protein